MNSNRRAHVRELGDLRKAAIPNPQATSDKAQVQIHAWNTTANDHVPQTQPNVRICIS
ncbi:MAG: hypothetical protein ACXWKG_00865 [Limisphaerales bacterium]